MHAPILPENAHPAYLAATVGMPPLHGKLDDDDVRWAERIAKKVGDRYEKGATATMKFRPKGYSIEQVNREGFAAELFVARWTGEEWHQGIRKKPDVGDDIEVRSSRHDGAYMPVYDFDETGRRFVLVTGRSPQFRIVGWLPGKEAKVFDYWQPKGSVLRGVKLDFACFAVPQAELRPMQEFRRAVSEAP